MTQTDGDAVRPAAPAVEQRITCCLIIVSLYAACSRFFGQMRKRRWRSLDLHTETTGYSDPTVCDTDPVLWV